MKLSLNWLQTLTDIPKKTTPEVLGELLTTHTAEVEEILDVSQGYSDVFTGKLLSFEPHPQSDKLHVGQFDMGKLGKKQIVFGSVHVLHKDDILPVALDGARLRSGLQIQKNNIRGISSEGMVCDQQELGLKSPGLIRFAKGTPLGTSLSKIAPSFGDILIDLDNKSLTHRPDLMGHRGFVREINALLKSGAAPKSPTVSFPAKARPVQLTVETDACLRACFAHVEGITVGPSSLDERIRLEHLGTRAISNIVDTTNLVMLEYGQPMHAFDADKIQGSLIIRQAKKGEKLLALDGETYTLTPEDTVVADESGVLSIAGIMGGEASSVTEKTTRIIFEAACWDAVAIRHTSARLGLRSESSMRYEKTLDPQQCSEALHAALHRTCTQQKKCKITSALTDYFPSPTKAPTIKLDPELVRKRSGLDISNKTIEEKLTALGFEVTGGKTFSVKIPSFRATKDVTLPEDLIEEVVRLQGFDQIPAILPALTLAPPHPNPLRDMEWHIRSFLAARGFLEAYNYSFVDDHETELTETKEAITLANPLSEEHAQLRRTLLSNILKPLESELRTHKNLRLFEIGKTFHPCGEVLPREEPHLGVLLAETSGLEDDHFFELKTEIERLMKSLGIEKMLHYKPAETPLPYAHPAKCADIFSEQEGLVGTLFVVHPGKHSLKKARLIFAELQLEKLLSLSRSQETTYSKVSPFPAVRRDVSLIVPSRMSIAEIESVALSATDLLKDLELFDEFEDETKIGKNLKNLAFHLLFQSSEKTLEEHEIEKAFNALVETLKKQCGAELRLAFDKS